MIKPTLEFVFGAKDMQDTELGITAGKRYSVVYEGKDEIGVVNDFGIETEYSLDFFQLSHND